MSAVIAVVDVATANVDVAEMTDADVVETRDVDVVETRDVDAAETTDADADAMMSIGQRAVTNPETIRPNRPTRAVAKI
jgi:hypothetical protein